MQTSLFVPFWGTYELRVIPYFGIIFKINYCVDRYCQVKNINVTNRRFVAHKSKFVMLSMLRIFDSGIRESKDSHYSIYAEGWEC